MLDLDPAPLPREVRLVGALREDPVLARARPRRRTTPARPRGRPTTAPRAPPARAASTRDRRARAASRPARRARGGAFAARASESPPSSPSPSRSRSNSTRRRGDLARELADARLRRVQPQLQLVELHHAVGHPHDLPVGDERPGAGRRDEREDLREVPAERASVAADEAHRAVGRDRDDRPEPVPLRLVGPALAERHLGLELREHRSRQVAGDRALRHPPTLPRSAASRTSACADSPARAPSGRGSPCAAARGSG